MVKQYDAGLKKLVGSDPQAFVQWLVPSAKFVHFYPQKLDAVELEVDILIEVLVNSILMLLHIEFQTYNDATMAERLLWYNVVIRKQYKLPILSFAVYLLRDGEVPQSPLVYSVPTEQEVLRFHFVNIEIGKLAPEDILNLKHENLLPLLPLTRGGTERKVVEQTLTTLDQHAKENDLKLLAFALASLVMRREKNPDFEWLLRRFSTMHDLLEDSPIFQMIQQEGVEKGLEQGVQKGKVEALREAILAIVSAHYPKLTRLAKMHVAATDDVDRLQRLIVNLTMVHSAEEARALITALYDDSNDEED